MKKHALGCLLSFFPLMVNADYAVQLHTDALTERLEWDDSSFFSVDDIRSQGVSVTADFYFYDVKKQGPWAESAYLQRAGFIRFKAQQRDLDYPDNSALDGDTKSASAKAYIVIEDMIIWDIRAGQNKQLLSPVSANEESGQLHFGIGSYFLEHHSVIVALQYNNYKIRDKARLDTRGIVVDYRSVLPLGKQHLAFGGGLGLHWGEYDNRYQYVGKDVDVVRFALNGFVGYYPIDNLGITLALAVDSKSDVHDDALDTIENQSSAQLSLALRYFPLDWLAIDASIYGGSSQLNFEDDNTDEDVIGRGRGGSLGLMVRF